MFSQLFKPFRLGTLEIKNRIVMPAMVTLLANENGGVTERMIDYYRERARGGVGLIIVESAYVKEEDRDRGRLGIENPQLQVGLSELSETIQEDGARAFLQLNHRGAALSIRRGRGPDELNLEEIEVLIEAFAKAAKRAQEAGFDGVEIHGANNYLINQFLSPLTNHRDDSYGKTFEGRLKLPLKLIKRIREEVGNSFPVIFRMVGHQYSENGLRLEDTQKIAKIMEKTGVNILHVIAGGPGAPYWHCPPMAIERGCHAHLSEAIKKSVKIPVIAVGRINDPILAESILVEGKADLVAMGRALIADPYLPTKAKSGKVGEIRKCLACNYCRKRVVQFNRTIRCAINAEAGREKENRIYPSRSRKKVMVIGGGPAGMEAARILSLRGHQVSLYEKEVDLGGQVNLASIPPYKEEIRNIIDFLVNQIGKMPIAISIQKEVRLDTIMRENPDVIVLAIGSLPVIPKILGGKRETIFTPSEILRAQCTIGDKILIIGGGMVGCEVAEFLATGGTKVTIVDMLPEVANGVEFHTRSLLLERLNKLQIEIVTCGSVERVEGKSAFIVKENGEKMVVEVDGIVTAQGSEENHSLDDIIMLSRKPFSRVGENIMVSDIATAIREGFRIGRQI
jgi:2,4-dienoyl-CoA reductase-like NADH-dependent reductase (Old Yellow Enzyme family)/thioredoxin reductase